VFTQNAFRAAPVVIAEAHLTAAQCQPRHLIINTGNANAGTGDEGVTAATHQSHRLKMASPSQR
jgi:glutamate N-acetyltransferase/amino-acid N-acetyltransferase